MAKASSLVIPRVDGQVWIDKRSPYSLKYFINNEERVVETSATYNYNSQEPTTNPSGDLLSAGTLVKFTTASTIEKAKFPDDLESVLGVTATAVKLPSEEFPMEQVAVVQKGYIILDHPEETFAVPEDLLLTPQGNGYTKESIIGAPVYWFIGRMKKNPDASYSYISPSEKNYHGKLTLATPVGYPAIPVQDDSLNVGYDNLPRVGHVSAVTVEGSKVTRMVLHLNFSTFDTSLEWNWPLQHSISVEGTSHICGKIAANISDGNLSETVLTIRHGLFAASNHYTPMGFTNAVIAPESAEGTADFSKKSDTITTTDNLLLSGPGSISRCTNNCTQIFVRSPETLYFRVSGRVNYKFDKNHK